MFDMYRLGGSHGQRSPRGTYEKKKKGWELTWGQSQSVLKETFIEAKPGLFLMRLIN